MVSCRVEEVDGSFDADIDSSEEDGTAEKYTLALWPMRDSPTYLLLSSRHNKVMIWFCLCGVVCCILHCVVGVGWMDDRNSIWP